MPDDLMETVLDGLVGDREEFRKILSDAPGILRRVCRYAEHEALACRCKPWVIICRITYHGSGVSHAIYELYRERK